jgi:hypothetical protein
MAFCIVCGHGLFYFHLVLFVFIWYIFAGLGIMYQGKSGNPYSTSTEIFAFPPKLSRCNAKSRSDEICRIIVPPNRSPKAGLPDLSWYIIPKREKYTKISINRPNGHKRDQMTIKYANMSHCKSLQNLPKLGYFGLKICHLATLDEREAKQFSLFPV